MAEESTLRLMDAITGGLFIACELTQVKISSRSKRLPGEAYRKIIIIIIIWFNHNGQNIVGEFEFESEYEK